MKKKPQAITVPPEVMAKMLEIASLLLLADVIRTAAKRHKSIVITFGDEGPQGMVLPSTGWNSGYAEAPPQTKPDASK